MAMRLLRAFSAALFVLFFAALAHAADDKATFQARLDRVDASTRLDDPALKPWYLKLNIQLYDDTGKPSEKGTIEEWWAGPNLYKQIFTSPSYTATFLVNKDGKFRTTGAVEPPYLMEMLLRQVVHPMPRADETAGLTPQLIKTTNTSQQLMTASAGMPECIMLSRAMRKMAYPPVGLFPTFCMVPGKDILQVTYDNGIFMVARGSLGGFQQKIVPVDVKIGLSCVTTIGVKRIDAASSQMTVMKVAPLTEADFAVPASGMAPDNTPRVQMNFAKLKSEQSLLLNPVVPDSANQAQLSDPVQVQAVFGIDGKVRSMRLFSAPDPLLANSAMAAIMQWSIKPQQVDGKPVEVETNVEATFQRDPSQSEVGGRIH